MSYSMFHRIYFFAKWYCLSNICQSSTSFEFKRVSSKGTFWLENPVFRKIWKKNLEDQCFQKSWHSRLQERSPCILTKFLTLKTSFAGIFRNMHFFCAKKLCSTSSQRRLILKYQGNLVIKFDDNVMKFIL